MVHDNITLAYFLTHFTEGYRSSSYYGYFCLKGFHCFAKKNLESLNSVLFMKSIYCCAPRFKGNIKSSNSGIFIKCEIQCLLLTRDWKLLMTNA